MIFNSISYSIVIISLEKITLPFVQETHKCLIKIAPITHRKNFTINYD